MKLRLMSAFVSVVWQFVFIFYIITFYEAKKMILQFSLVYPLF